MFLFTISYIEKFKILVKKTLKLKFNLVKEPVHIDNYLVLIMYIIMHMLDSIQI